MHEPELLENGWPFIFVFTSDSCSVSSIFPFLFFYMSSYIYQQANTIKSIFMYSTYSYNVFVSIAGGIIVLGTKKKLRSMALLESCQQGEKTNRVHIKSTNCLSDSICPSLSLDKHIVVCGRLSALH